MVVDELKNIQKYEAILPALKDYKSYLYSECEDMNAFHSDSKKSTLIISKEGSCKLATTWREVKNSRDTTAVIILKEGEFALFLPSEKYLKQLNKTKFPLKAIDQFTLEGEYIRTFSSAREAEIFLFGNGHRAGRVSFIQQAARGAKSKAYGYKWAYHDVQKAKGEEL